MVGNSQRVSFWKDIWCGATPLCVSFPSLFTLANPKEAWVKDVWNGSIGVGSWSPRFTRSFNDWEMDEVEDLLLCLCGQKVILEEEDWVWWMKTKDEFSRQSHLQSLRAGLFSFVSNEDHLEIVCAAKSKLFCMGGNMRQSFNLGPS